MRGSMLIHSSPSVDATQPAHIQAPSLTYDMVADPTNYLKAGDNSTDGQDGYEMLLEVWSLGRRADCTGKTEEYAEIDVAQSGEYLHIIA